MVVILQLDLSIQCNGTSKDHVLPCSSRLHWSTETRHDRQRRVLCQHPAMELKCFFRIVFASTSLGPSGSLWAALRLKQFGDDITALFGWAIRRFACLEAPNVPLSEWLVAITCKLLYSRRFDGVFSFLNVFGALILSKHTSSIECVFRIGTMKQGFMFSLHVILEYPYVGVWRLVLALGERRQLFGPDLNPIC